MGMSMNKITYNDITALSMSSGIGTWKAWKIFLTVSAPRQQDLQRKQ